MLAAFTLCGVTSLLGLVLPLCALNAVDGASRGLSLETLGLLALIAGAGLLARTCISAARDRVLLRTGLWLEHTLGREMLEAGVRLGSPPEELEKRTRALGAVAEALSERTVVAALEAPWLALSLGALALLHPLMAAAAAVPVAILLVLALRKTASLGRLAEQRGETRDVIRTWWLAAALAPRLGAGAIEEWDVVNGARIARAYALGRRSALFQDLARLIRACAQVTFIVAGAWLMITRQLTVAALLAGVLINAGMLEVVGRLVASMPVIGAATSAYRRLRGIGGRVARQRETTADVKLARLDVRGPLTLALTTVLVVIMVGLGAAFARLGDIAGLAGGPIFETRVTLAQYLINGTARAHTRQGAQVRAGELVVSVDTAALDRQIAALKAQAETAKRQLALVRREASAASGEQSAADRPSIPGLEQRIGELEQEAQWLLSRIAAAEDELANSEIRAPASGRVVALGIPRAGAPAGPVLVELEIAINDGPLFERLLDPLLHRSEPRPSPVAQLPSPRG